MRVLVTGASGFVGRHLCAALLARGHDVVGAARREPELDGVRPVRLDVTDAAAVETLMRSLRPDGIVHLAGRTATTSWDQLDQLLRVNAAAAGTLLAAAADDAPNARILLVGSAHEYGAATPERPFRETDPLRPASPYGVSKVAQELLGMAWADRGMAVVATRSFNHTGPGAPRSTALGSFAAQIAEIEAGAEPVLRLGSLEAERDFLDVRDVSAAYMTLLETAAPGEAYNVASGTALAIGELLDLVLERSDLDRGALRLEAIEGSFGPSRLVGDPAKLRALGWEPTVAVERSIEDTLAWHRNALAVAAPDPRP
ncbi:MAG TPA: NAD-dependent epimerase/dehydratase family protein [Acidimicrobiales bacterium]|nr:NAD-dependent epimerase/dehydratase family protein [Acidimicrobiales bacterium]